MKILYVWVEKFKNLSSFGISLSSNRKYRYDMSVNHVSFEPIPALPNDFFPRPVVDIAAIIGENGVGKSNALELICRALKGTLRSALRSDYLIVYEDQGLRIAIFSSATARRQPANLMPKFKRWIQVCR